MAWFVDTLLPLPLQSRFTYALTDDEAALLQPGMRLAVPFGKNKMYTGLALDVHQNPPLLYEARPIVQCIDKEALIHPQQLVFWQWLADYYMCSLGEVYRAALPKMMLLESETLLHPKADAPADTSVLTDEAYLLWDALQVEGVISIETAAKIVPLKKLYRAIDLLIQGGFLQTEALVTDPYKPKTSHYIRLHPQYDTPQGLQQLLQELKNADRQKQIVLYWFQWKGSQPNKPLPEKTLRDALQITKSSLDSLVQKQMLERYIPHFSDMQTEATALLPLNTAQSVALTQIHKAFDTHSTVLLHGITASGKTELYKHLIQEVVEKGQQVLYLLPEIALTAQLVQRLKQTFGNRVAVFHSRYTQKERLTIWHQVRLHQPEASIVVGARSALFLPFAHLGLVVVDEEHEPSFKQQEPAPRYHGRDAALVLARMHGAKTLLGSATPSVESYENALTGKYGLVQLHQRHAGANLPEIRCIDLQDARMRKQLHGPFSQSLLDAIKDTIDKGEQVILFQNRRGFAPVMECERCGHVPYCPHCDVSLTYHKHKQQLRCHYCGYHIAKPNRCLQCTDPHLNTKGLGTEQIEEALLSLHPEWRVARMDTDTTKGKYKTEALLEQFKNREIDILVGTQMVAKGLDFEWVTLVGIICADALWYQPDFRAAERCYQLLLQVAGRAGRANKPGQVLIQTYQPQHPLLQKIKQQDFDGLFELQKKERMSLSYPPFGRLIRIQLRHKNFEINQQAARWLAQQLVTWSLIKVLGPEEPPIGKIRNEYQQVILLKIPKETPLKPLKNALLRVFQSMNSSNAFRPVKKIIEVDPY